MEIEGVRMEFVPIDKIKIGKYRVRTTFNEEKMRSLATSIKQKKVLTPIWVTPPDDEGYYGLIAGERRLRAAKQAGLKEIPVTIREVGLDDAILEMGIENIQREDLSFYERGRWVAKMTDREEGLGWTVSALAEETGLTRTSLQNWLEFYEESERIKKVPIIGREFKPEKMPLTGLLETKRAPLAEEKRVELAIEATKMERPPRVTEIERATRILEQEPQLVAREALERARGITLLLSIPTDLIDFLKDYSKDQEFSMQEAIIDLVRRGLSGYFDLGWF